MFEVEKKIFEKMEHSITKGLLIFAAWAIRQVLALPLSALPASPGLALSVLPAALSAALPASPAALHRLYPRRHLAMVRSFCAPDACDSPSLVNLLRVVPGHLQLVQALVRGVEKIDRNHHYLPFSSTADNSFRTLARHHTRIPQIDVRIDFQLATLGNTILRVEVNQPKPIPEDPPRRATSGPYEDLRTRGSVMLRKTFRCRPQSVVPYQRLPGRVKPMRAVS